MNTDSPEKGREMNTDSPEYKDSPEYLCGKYVERLSMLAEILRVDGNKDYLSTTTVKILRRVLLENDIEQTSEPASLEPMFFSR